MYWEIIALVLIGSLFFLFVYVENKDPVFATIKIGNITLKAEVADTYTKKLKGLMGRDEIGTDAMLFTDPPSARQGIWMKGMKFPIDIIWANDTEIVDIVRNAPACKSLTCEIYTPKTDSNYIIEVPANWTKENKISIGTEIKVPKNI